MNLHMKPSFYLNFSMTGALISFINYTNLNSSLLFIIKTILTAKMFTEELASTYNWKNGKTGA